MSKFSSDVQLSKKSSTKEDSLRPKPVPDTVAEAKEHEETSADDDAANKEEELSDEA